jgi:hypothetical protein
MRNVRGLLSKLLLAAGLSAVLATAPALAADDVYDTDGPAAEAMAFDAVVVRPVSFVGSVISTAFFVVSLPFSAIGGNAEQAANRLVVEPWAYTFSRPLGGGYE